MINTWKIVSTILNSPRSDAHTECIPRPLGGKVLSTVATHLSGLASFQYNSCIKQCRMQEFFILDFKMKIHSLNSWFCPSQISHADSFIPMSMVHRFLHACMGGWRKFCQYSFTRQPWTGLLWMISIQKKSESGYSLWCSCLSISDRTECWQLFSVICDVFYRI